MSQAMLQRGGGGGGAVTSFFWKAEDPSSERAGLRGTDPTLCFPCSRGRSLGSGGEEQICCKPQICCLRE